MVGPWKFYIDSPLTVSLNLCDGSLTEGDGECWACVDGDGGGDGYGDACGDGRGYGPDDVLDRRCGGGCGDGYGDSWGGGWSENEW